ncbi:hypothetical protein A2U01_0061926, partial [Trifolium medium]|nr:hypothetical protein [Trifolium medium]
MSSASRSPSRKASYSSWLFDVGNERARETSIRMPFSFSRMIPAPALVALDAPSTKIIHLSAASVGDTGVVIS